MGWYERLAEFVTKIEEALALAGLRDAGVGVTDAQFIVAVMSWLRHRGVCLPLNDLALGRILDATRESLDEAFVAECARGAVPFTNEMLHCCNCEGRGEVSSGADELGTKECPDCQGAGSLPPDIALARMLSDRFEHTLGGDDACRLAGTLAQRGVPVAFLEVQDWAPWRVRASWLWISQGARGRGLLQVLDRASTMPTIVSRVRMHDGESLPGTLLLGGTGPLLELS